LCRLPKAACLGGRQHGDDRHEWRPAGARPGEARRRTQRAAVGAEDAPDAVRTGDFHGRLPGLRRKAFMRFLNAQLRRNRDRRGALLVEAAIVFPLLLLLTFGLLEYGWLFMKIEQVENTARQAARVGATASAKTSDVTALVTTMMNDAGMAGKYTLTITPGAIEGSPTGTMN